MLDYLSQPVAFATAPLSASMNKPRRDTGSSSDTDIEDPISRNISRGLSLIKATRSRILARHDSSSNVADSDNSRAGPSNAVNTDIPDDWDDDDLEKDCKVMLGNRTMCWTLLCFVLVQMTTWQIHFCLLGPTQNLRCLQSARELGSQEQPRRHATAISSS